MVQPFFIYLFSFYLFHEAFRYTGVLMNPTYAAAVSYGCPGRINRTHFIVYWVGPLVGALVFKDAVNLVETLCGLWNEHFKRRARNCAKRALRY